MVVLMEESDFQKLLQSLVDLVNGISALGDTIKLYRKDCAQLIRRIKLLAPLFEEVRDSKVLLPDDVVLQFRIFKDVLSEAKQLLHLCHDGSKLYMVLERDMILRRFQVIAADLTRGLNTLPYKLLDISDEVREQVELVHNQLTRAKGVVDMQGLQLYEDAVSILDNKCDRDTDHTLLRRLAENLHLKTMSDLKQESQAIQAMIIDKGGDIDRTLECVASILRKLNAIAVADTPEVDRAHLEMARLTIGSSVDKQGFPTLPDDFRCPISLEVMKDPVIVATGQTYERACIQKWLDDGHKTCPKTQQLLPHLSLTPNYVLRSLISQWCEANGVELPQSAGPSKTGKTSGILSEVSPGDRATIDGLVKKLSCNELEVQREAAAAIRMLAKRSIENRACIAEAGAIPPLVGLLSVEDSRTQEHAVTAILNLSINDNNKGQIVMAGAIEPIVEVLRHGGSMEARENAAATLFSLSVVDENKVIIGASGAILALVDLLRVGSNRGKKDAATALFNLSIYQGNKIKAVRAGVVPLLMNFLRDLSSGMIDEALAILAILATHQEGRSAIGQAAAIPVLVELIKSGSPRNKENAAAILLALCSNDPSHLGITRKLGATEVLMELAESGTARARRKAVAILDLMWKREA